MVSRNSVECEFTKQMKKLFLFLFLLSSISALAYAESSDIQKYEKACKLNDGGGCYNLGVLYAEGHGVKQDYFKAKEYYKNACDLKNAGGCEIYAKLNSMEK